MSTVTVVTSFSQAGYEQYGLRMLQSAVRHLPDHIDILAYYNEQKPAFDHPRITLIDNYSIDGGVRDFMKRHGNNPRRWGLSPSGEENFRFSINRFCHKMYALYDASRLARGGILVWVDADTLFFDAMPADFVDIHLPYPHYAAILDRGLRYHMEAGYVALRTTHPFHLEFMERYVDYCRRDLFLQEIEHHDAYLMNQLLRQMEAEKKITTYNLSPGYDGAGHPWLASPLAQFSDHMKGRIRKKMGSSFKEDLKIKRTESYWHVLPERSQSKESS